MVFRKLLKEEELELKESC